MTIKEWRAYLISKAKEYIGTPWAHQGRVKNVGIDCIGLVVRCANEAGMEYEDPVVYRKLADEPRLRQVLIDNGTQQISIEDAEPGDIVFFRLFGRMQHAGIISSIDPVRFIHAHNSGLAVVRETELDDYWRDLIHSVWRYREFIDE